MFLRLVASSVESGALVTPAGPFSADSVTASLPAKRLSPKSCRVDTRFSI